MEVPAASAPMDSAALATARSITAPEEAVSVPVISAASAGMRIFLTICSVSISRDRKAPDGAAGRTTAALGGEIRVPTLYGDVMCKVKEGTQSGSKIRLKGKGVVSMKDKNAHGDQYVVIQIQVPKNLTPAAKEKLQEYKKVSGF